MALLNTAQVWQKVKDSTKAKIGQTAFDTWFGPIQVKEDTDSSIILEVPDSFFKDWVIQHYLDLIKGEWEKTSGEKININWAINPSLADTSQQDRFEQFKAKIQDEPTKLSLNPKYTFDNFVIGPSNRFSHAASLAVSHSPAKTYNPLFIYGGVGLGKTHLMQAICHEVLRQNPSAKISYITSEKFTNEMIESIQHRTSNKFRQKYRGVDIIVIDDIHFIAGKESTQEEFFHTFNALYDSHKQIIISSDRPPKEIAKLEERLVSRFGWGLVTDIQPPDLETRIAILKKKMEKEPIQMPNNVMYFIAENIKTNIRELEGAMIRVMAYSLLEGKPVDLELAKDVLKDSLREVARIINIETIQKKVAEFFNITVNELRSQKRSPGVMLPRQIAIYISRELTNLSLFEIGQGFGGKDHTTILHSYNKIKSALPKNETLKANINKIILDIKQ